MESPLTEATLHVAGTRPAMFYGIPWELFIPLLIGTTEIGVVKWWWMALTAPVWGAAVWLVRRDYNAPRVWRLWFQDAALDLHGRSWGGPSTNPFSLHPAKRFRGIPHVR